MEQTKNLNLNRWVPEDFVRLTQINQNFDKIDEDAATVPRIAYGSYTGTGKYGKSNPNRLDFAESLGKTPQFIVVMEIQGNYQLILIRGMTQQVCFYPPEGNERSCPLTWSSTGVSWYNESNAGRQLNNGGKEYFYFAIG